MKLWLDDTRPVPDNSWTHVTSVDQATSVIALSCNLMDKTFEEASLDHDLGDYAEDGGDGIKLIDWMEETGIWPQTITVHSMNPVGVQNMMRAIDASGIYPPSYFSNRRTKA